MRYTVLGILLLCAALNASLASAKDIYVSRSGDDANAGTRQTPLATIQKALEVRRAGGPGTIWIGEGTFYLDQGMVLGAKDGGTGDLPLVIRGAGLQKTRLSGARVVKDLRPIPADLAKTLVSAEAKRKVLVADLLKQGFPHLDALPLQFRAPGSEEVIFADQPMQAARWPNAGFTAFTDVIDSGASGITHWVQRNVYRPGSFRFPGDRAKQWDFQRGVWLHGFWCWDWCDETIKAKSYDAKSGELRLAAKHAYGVGSPRNARSQRRFYAVHVFEELDRPGEYFLDRANNRLFFWPPGHAGKQAVQLTLCRRPLIRANGVANVTICDLTVENGRDSGILISNGEHCRVANCLVRNMGRAGISMSGTDVGVLRCEVTQTGAYGISIQGGDRKTLTPGNCYVLGCRIHHIGRLDWMNGRGISVRGCGNRVANNLIYSGPTGAISYGGNEHILELNEIHDMCIYYSDVGVFYTGRDWASRGNIVRWNYIHDVTSNEGSGSSAIYLDDCDSGDTVVGNIVYRGAGRGILLGGGRDNVIRGNVFIDLPIGVHVDARGPRGITLDKPGSWNLLDKCKQVGYLSPLWKKRYPRLATIMDNEPLMSVGNVIQDNLLIDCKKPYAISKGIKEEWLSRANNIELTRAEAQILFKQDSAKPFVLSNLPAVWKQVTGFQPIPIQKIGPAGLDGPN